MSFSMTFSILNVIEHQLKMSSSYTDVRTAYTSIANVGSLGPAFSQPPAGPVYECSILAVYEYSILAS